MKDGRYRKVKIDSLEELRWGSKMWLLYFSVAANIRTIREHLSVTRNLGRTQMDTAMVCRVLDYRRKVDEPHFLFYLLNPLPKDSRGTSLLLRQILGGSVKLFHRTCFSFEHWLGKRNGFTFIVLCSCAIVSSIIEKYIYYHFK